MALWIPEYLQTKTYSAMRLRGVIMDSGVQEGAVGASDLKVTQRASGGANLSVDIAEGASFVKGDLTSRQGLYHVYNDAVVNLAIGTNTSGNPRLDQVVLYVNDSTDGLAGADNASLQILPGSPQAGATLDNRSGAATLPLTAMRVADVLVASGASSIVNANIRDRRQWARGFYKHIIRTSNAPNTGDYSATGSNTWQLLDTTNLRMRVEVSGNFPVRVTLRASGQQSAAGSAALQLGCYIDGVMNPTSGLSYSNQSVAGLYVPAFFTHTYTLAAGTHLIEPAYNVSAGAWVLLARTDMPLVFSVEEVLRQNVSND